MRRHVVALVATAATLCLAACGAPSESADGVDQSAALEDSTDGGDGNGQADASAYAHDTNVLSCWVSYTSADGSYVTAASGQTSISSLVAKGSPGLVVADARGSYSMEVYWEGSLTEYLPVYAVLSNVNADGTVSNVSSAWLPSLTKPSKGSLVQLQAEVVPFERTEADGGTPTYDIVDGNCSIYEKGQVIAHPVTP